jgi:hypothetical protein
MPPRPSRPTPTLGKLAADTAVPVAHSLSSYLIAARFLLD